MGQNVAKYRYPNEKWWWFSFGGDVVIQSAWVLYRSNKDKGDESLFFLVFRKHVVNMFFLKY